MYPPRFTLQVHNENATHDVVALVESKGASMDLSTEIYLSLPTADANRQQQQPCQPPSSGHYSGENQDAAKPTIQQLMKELYNDVTSEWNPIGTFLKISDGELKAISQNEHGDPKKCLIAMLKVWLHQTNPPASWINIADAMECIGRPDIALKIRQTYCEHGPT